MVRQNIVLGSIFHLTMKPWSPCAGCMLGKAHHDQFPASAFPAFSTLLRLINSDATGLSSVASLSVVRYFVSFPDDSFRSVTAYLNTQNSETLSNIKIFRAHGELTTRKLICSLRFSHSGEYISSDFCCVLRTSELQHQLPVLYSPQNNGVSERFNCTMMGLHFSLVHHQKTRSPFISCPLPHLFGTYEGIRNFATPLPLGSLPHGVLSSMRRLLLLPLFHLSPSPLLLSTSSHVYSTMLNRVSPYRK